MPTTQTGFLLNALAAAIMVGGALAIGATPAAAQDDDQSPPSAADATVMAPDAPNEAPPSSDTGSDAPVDDSSGADSSASFQTFYDSLASQGTWIQSPDYGYIWQPQVSAADWAPYTNGHWVYTDLGWTWVSDEPWGWATYHYGRWVNLNGSGWYWVPGYTWAPAWVSWRYGGGYAGWAPLPPDSFVGIDYSDDDSEDLDVGFHIGGDCDGFYGIGPAWYIFLPINCLGDRHYHDHYFHRGDNFAIINHTTNVTNINIARNGDAAQTGGFRRVTTGGPLLTQVNAISTTPVARLNLVRANRPGLAGTESGNSLSIYAPHVNPGTSAQPPRVAGSLGRTAINRGTDIMQPLAANARTAPQAATEAQVQQARIALDHAPANAKILTDTASVHPLLQTPLTSLKPLATRQEPATSVYNTAPGPVFQPQRSPSASGYNPAERVYNPGGEGGQIPGRVYLPSSVYSTSPPVYSPHPATAPNAAPTESHTYVHPTAPSYAPTVHPSSGGESPGRGGYSGGAGGAPSGGGGASGGHGSPSQNH